MHQRLRWIRAVQQSVCRQLPWLPRSIASGMTNRQLAIFSAVPISGAMSAIGAFSTALPSVLVSVIGGIVLQNSFLGCAQFFPGALVRSLGKYVGGHMNSL